MAIFSCPSKKECHKSLKRKLLVGKLLGIGVCWSFCVSRWVRILSVLSQWWKWFGAPFSIHLAIANRPIHPPTHLRLADTAYHKTYRPHTHGTQFPSSQDRYQPSLRCRTPSSHKSHKCLETRSDRSESVGFLTRLNIGGSAWIRRLCADGLDGLLRRRLL